MRSVAALGLLLAAAPSRAAEFRNPVIGDAVVTAYFDLGGVKDWNCGGHTYGGHRGTDIGIIGRFVAMDQGRDVVAGAPGRVIRTHDGEFDRCTTGNCAGGGGFGNYVAVEHDDGKVTYYAHLRRGSVAVSEGQRVACGQRLGQVGSSGFSTGPHLHFEVRVGGAADDPFTGPCGGPLTYWRDQGPYRGLPSSECAEAPPPPPPPPPARPDMHLEARLELPGGRVCDFDDCADFIRDGRSGGVPDAWVGEEVRFAVVVHNRGDGPTAGESDGDAAVELEYALPDVLEPVRYLVETDHPAGDRSSWRRNDAMDNPHNPPADAPPASGVIRLNGFSAGESKRFTLTARARARSIDGEGHAEGRFWIRHLRNYYGEKTGWDDPVEVNDGQSFNGGDLRVAAALDVFDPTAFLFDAPDGGQVEGWRRCAPDAVGQMHLNLDEGALAIEVTGAAPCVEGPPVAVPLDGWPGVRVVARQYQGPREGWLSWTTVDHPEFDETRRVRFRTGGGGAFDALHLAPGWYGTLTRLRLEPVDGPGDGNPWFDVDEVRLTADAPPPPPPDAGPSDTDPPPVPDGGPPPAEDAAPPSFLPEFDAGPHEPAPNAVSGRRVGGAAYEGGCATTPGGSAPWWLMLAAVGRRRRGRRRAGRGRCARGSRGSRARRGPGASRSTCRRPSAGRRCRGPRRASTTSGATLRRGGGGGGPGARGPRRRRRG